MKKRGRSRIFELTTSSDNTISILISQIPQPNLLPNCPLLTPNLLLHIGQDVTNAAWDIMVNNPCHTSVLSGKAYVHELISPETHPNRIQDALHMLCITFLKICTWFQQNNLLSNSKHLGLEEQVAIFLWIVGRGASNRDTQERFQHSGDIVSRYLLCILLSIYYFFLFCLPFVGFVIS